MVGASRADPVRATIRMSIYLVTLLEPHHQVSEVLVHEFNRFQVVGAIWPIAIKLCLARAKGSSPASLGPSLRSLTLLYRLVFGLKFDQELSLRPCQ